MNIKKYKQTRAIVAIYVSILVSVSMSLNNLILAVFAVITGMIFLFFARSKTKIIIDEREKAIREKAAQMTYSIFVPTLGIGTFLLFFPSKSGLSVFSKGEFIYLESLGTVFAYLTLFILTIYSLSYHFVNRKYGGNNEE